MMKAFFSILLWLAVVFSCAAQKQWELDIQEYRDSVDAAFSNPETSILVSEDIPGFKGVPYFPINKKFRVKARFEPIKIAQAVEMKTSGSRTPLYKPYGRLIFKLGGKKHSLVIYQSADPGRPEIREYLLLAFTDLTSGVDTYGGGRYIEYTTKDIKKKMILDFNHAFNPYCAYNHKFSCVIPPAENHLDIRVEAGAKKFH